MVLEQWDVHMRKKELQFIPLPYKKLTQNRIPLSNIKE